MYVDTRTIAFATVTGVLLFGTAYSVQYSTSLDTSNPLLTNLPHPLQSTHYFANKSNWLNVLFIKKAWGWTSAAFFFLYLTSPSSAQTKERMFKWLAGTAIWAIFTSWFFGPAVFERVIALSGGECILSLPTGGIIPLSKEYCLQKTRLSPSTHPSLFATPFMAPADNWVATPRLRNGHDISGHVFLLTLSILFLADQLRFSFRRGSYAWGRLHTLAVGANVALVAIWLFANYTTSVYFHTVLEKFTGYCKSYLSTDLDSNRFCCQC